MANIKNIIANFWDKRSTKYDREIQKHDDIYDDRIKRIKPWLKQSDSVLDFACASGEISLELSASAANITGIDISQKMIELANKKISRRQVENVRFYHLDIFDLDLVKHSYNVIMALNIIHLLVEVPKTIERLNELLPKDGLLITETPCLGEQNWFLKFALKLAYRLNLIPPIQESTQDELKSLLIEGNFNILEMYTCNSHMSTQWIVAQKI